MLEGLTPPNRQITCKVATVADSLEPSDKEILLTAVLDSSNWPVKTLVRALNQRGLQISDTPIIAHRFKNCVCFR